MTQADVEKLNVLLHISLHWILKIYRPVRITNDNIEERRLNQYGDGRRQVTYVELLIIHFL